MKFPTLALLAAAALTAGACTKRPVRPQFTVVSTDSLISGNGFSCDFEYRFASIANAQDSPALATAAIVGIVLNAILPGKDYEFGSDLQGDTSVNFKV